MGIFCNFLVIGNNYLFFLEIGAGLELKGIFVLEFLESLLTTMESEYEAFMASLAQPTVILTLPISFIKLNSFCI